MKALIKAEVEGEEIVYFYTTEEATAYFLGFNEVIKKQREFVIAKLLKDGSISRNYALGHFITRLSSRICEAKERGHEITGAWDEAKRDYIYTLIKKEK